MTPIPDFDLPAAHKFFSVQCFNEAWTLIDKQSRTSEENEQMVRLTQASLWHWSRREDCTATNLSVGYWQAARVYALVEDAAAARRYGLLALECAKDAGPFYLGYAHEALARAAAVAGDDGRKKEHLAQAQALAGAVENAEEKKWLTNDLATIT